MGKLPTPITVTAARTETLRTSDIYNKVYVSLCFCYTCSELKQELCMLDRSHDKRVYSNLF